MTAETVEPEPQLQPVATQPKQKTALITGIGGQDGSYLSALLLSKGYRVVGVIRRQSVPEQQTTRLSHILDRLDLHYGDVTDAASVARIVRAVRPDEVYNLAAQSHVGISSQVPEFTGQTNALGVLNVLEAVRMEWPIARVYQASSSEMFGWAMDEDGFQRETTPMLPVSPYGIAKLYAYHMVRHYRVAYGMFAANGILFNHCSPVRGANFVEAKIVKAAVAIANGTMKEPLRLGNVTSQRDIGHSQDYVRAMWMILQAEQPDEWVVSMGETHAIFEICRDVFDRFGLDWRRHVIIGDPQYMRAQELFYLKGDSSKIRQTLGWQPEHTWRSIIDDLVAGRVRAN